MSNGIIRQDSLSKILIIISVSLLLFMSTFNVELLTKSLFAVSLILGGLTLSLVTKEYAEDNNIDLGERNQIFIYSIIALGTVLFLSTIVPAIHLVELAQIPFSIIVLFGLLIAVAEEVFFRGFLLNFLIGKAGNIFGIFGSALIFAIYHLNVYGTSPQNLIFVFGAGIILGFIAFRSRRVSTVMIAHIMNNLFAILFFT